MLNFLVLEFGSKSLKIHRTLETGKFQKVKMPWALGHEVYREGGISSSTRGRISEVIGKLVSRGFRKDSMLAIATGAVRDAPDRAEFLQFIREQVKIGVRTLSGREEASLLAQGFLQASGERPALVIDIGGGSLEMVYLGTDRTVLRDSLPLGAIRLHYLGREARGSWNARLVGDSVQTILQEASVIQLPKIHATGGPVKAIHRALGKSLFGRAELESLEHRVMETGAPACLSEERRQIFLPGVMVLRRLMEHCRADTMEHVAIPIGRIFLERFMGQAGRGVSGSLNAQLLESMRITQIYQAKDLDSAASPQTDSSGP